MRATKIILGTILISSISCGEPRVKDKRGILSLGYGSGIAHLGLGSLPLSSGYGLEGISLGETHSHSVSTINRAIPLPVPHPVPYPVDRPVPIPHPVPVPYDRPIPVPVSVPRPYPVHITKTIPIDVPRAVPVPVPQPVAVAVPHPVPVSLPVKSYYGGHEVVLDGHGIGLSKKIWW